MPTQYPQELKTRALRLLSDRRENHPNESLYTSYKEISQRLGISPETLRK
ncbi:hypothetical protein [Rothia nasisuis]|nr:hypothetical protein [Rothia nasisuis]